jgi:hypothetical protein
MFTFREQHNNLNVFCKYDNFPANGFAMPQVFADSDTGWMFQQTLKYAKGVKSQCSASQI